MAAQRGDHRSQAPVLFGGERESVHQDADAEWPAVEVRQIDGASGAFDPQPAEPPPL
jgi:hypothetical protein